MTARRVWAPSARAVELVVAGTRLPLVRGAGGWYEAELDGPDAGGDYRFSLDGGPAMPDPRSPFQPGGVDGPSRPVDHGAYIWHDAGWRRPPLAASVLYELHVGTFTSEGTFEAVLTRLDHLLELGVTAIELMPVAEFPGGRGWGYDGVLPFAPHHAYGGPDGLKRLVDGCHGRGMAVVIDVVYNHLGPSGNVLPAYGPYLTDRYRTPWGQAINLDGRGSDEVRRYFIDNALMWLRDYHADGLRLDAVHTIFDASALHFLEQLSLEVEASAVGRGVVPWLIAESDANDPRLVRPRELGGYGLDAVWNDDFHHAVHALLTGEQTGYYEDFGTVGDLVDSLRHGFVYANRYSHHRGRHHGRSAAGVPSTRFVGFTQNHDQVGNRAGGERTSALMSPGRLRVAAALVCCGPFVPLLFQGEEWGATTPFQYFTDHDDPDVGRAVTEGRRREFASFGWEPDAVADPQAETTWSASRLRWDERDDPAHAELLAWYRRLLTLRRDEPDLRGDRVDVRLDEGGGCVTIRRGAIALVVNVGPAAAAVRVGGGPVALLATSDRGIDVLASRLHLPADSVAILRM